MLRRLILVILILALGAVQSSVSPPLSALVKVGEDPPDIATIRSVMGAFTVLSDSLFHGRADDIADGFQAME